MNQKDINIRVVSRKSKLALIQVGEVFSQLPDVKYHLVGISSFGDKHHEISLLENPPADIFTRELDEALLQNEADIAIHSAKDLPSPLPEGLELIALTTADDSSDSLVSKRKQTLETLKPGARVGTSSPVRRRELLALRPDLEVVSIRGTIEERIAQVDNGFIDALIVATCALNRLGLQGRIAQKLPFETHPLQGHLAIVTSSNNHHISRLKSIFAQHDSRPQYGKVILAGFGPGNPDLITVASLNALKSAEVICYDDLTNKDFLQQFDAEKIYVGKRKDVHSYEQDQINRLLLDLARQGKLVVRLKGGDPMVFAHGGEESSYLRNHFVHVEVIPGISTGLALASLTQVPLTHRGLSSSVSFISGHKNTVKLPDTDTVVVYMGGSNIKSIAANAIASGRNPETPVLMVYNVSLPGQQSFRFTLKELSENDFKLPTPVIGIIGDVVNLYIEPPKTPLNPVILVTGTQKEYFEKMGKVIHQPLIQITKMDENFLLDNALEQIASFDWIIFTSRYAVQFFFENLYRKGLDTRSLAGIHIASVGKVTSDALLEKGIIPDLQPEDESSHGLLNEFKKNDISPANVLLPRSDIGLTILPEGLKAMGWEVKVIPIYKNALPGNLQALDLQNVDQIVFSSPSCVTNFLKLYGAFPQNKAFIFRGKETEKRYLKLQKDSQTN